MKVRLTVIFLIAIVSISCKNDVASALLMGEAAEYNFTNSRLKKQFVDEGLVSTFSLESENGGKKTKIEALYIGSQNRIKTDTVILYLHGNLPSMNEYWQHVANLANIGGKHRFGVMTFDYRGFGNSKGVSEKVGDLVADAEACIKWLKENGLNDRNLVLYGYSLGTMPAAHLTYDPKFISSIHKLVLEAPQTTSTKLLQDATGLSLSGSAVTSFHYDIPETLHRYKNHFLWIHGTDDKTASYDNFKKVYENYENPNKTSAEMIGLGHNTSEEMGFDTFNALMLNFIQKK